MADTNEFKDATDSRPDRDAVAAFSESELDDLLARAAALADDLADDASTGSTGKEQQPGGTTPPTGEVCQDHKSSDAPEGEFDRIESLLKRTSAQSASSKQKAIPATAVASAPRSHTTPNQRPNEKVPEVMKEFVHSGPSATPLPSAPAAAPVSEPIARITLDEAVAKSKPKSAPLRLPPGSKPGVVSTAMLSALRVGDKRPADTGPNKPRRPSLLAPIRRLRRALRTIFRKLIVALGISELLARRLGPAALVLCSFGVRVIEVLNRPMRRANKRVRRMVGMVAVATLATAVIVHIVSLF